MCSVRTKLQKPNLKPKRVTFHKSVLGLSLDNRKPCFKTPRSDYLITFKNFIESNIKTPIINKAKIILDYIQNCSTTVKRYFESASGTEERLICRINGQIPKQSIIEIRNVRNFNTFIIRQQGDGSAWEIISQTFYFRETANPVNSKRPSLPNLQTITKSILNAMNDLDMYIFKKLILSYTQEFSGIGKMVNSKKLVILYIIKNMKRRKHVKKAVIEIFQLWYLIQPVVIESCRYTGGITYEMDRILTDVDAIYKYWLNLRYKARESLTA